MFINLLFNIATKPNRLNYESSKQMRLCKVPCEQVIEEMYDGKLEMLKNGNLRYKQ